jgi:hypothetical protein
MVLLFFTVLQKQKNGVILELGGEGILTLNFNSLICKENL